MTMNDTKLPVGRNGDSRCSQIQFLPLTRMAAEGGAGLAGGEVGTACQDLESINEKLMMVRRASRIKVSGLPGLNIL